MQTQNYNTKLNMEKASFIFFENVQMGFFERASHYTSCNS